MEQTRIKVPQELFAPAESSCFTGIYELPVLKAGPDLFTFNEPLAWQLTITNTGDALLVDGSIAGSAKTSCARCLGSFDFPVLGEVEGFYLIGKDSAVFDDLEEDEFEILSEDSIIDLVPLFNAALLLELPLIPLCDDDCKGLCPLCGQDLNGGACACLVEASVEESDAVLNRSTPFSVLKDFPFED